MSEEKNKIVIVSPHCDDELIGCYEIIEKNKDNPPVILYIGDPPKERREEAIKLREYTGITIQMFVNCIPPVFLNPSTTLYFPSPDEIHPLHRMWGVQGESYLRNGLNVIFYTIDMNVKYIHEVENPNDKEELLNKIYPSQSDLWKYEKKYILFEGYQKWIM